MREQLHNIQSVKSKTHDIPERKFKMIMELYSWMSNGVEKVAGWKGVPMAVSLYVFRW